MATTPIDLPSEPVSGDVAPVGWDGRLRAAVATLARDREDTPPTLPVPVTASNTPGPWDCGRYDDTTVVVGARRGTAGYCHSAAIVIRDGNGGAISAIAKATSETVAVTETGYIYYSVVYDQGAGTWSATLSASAALPAAGLPVVIGYVTFGGGKLLGIRSYPLPSVILVVVDSNKVAASDTDYYPGFLDAKVKNSIEVDADALQLVGDEETPDAGDVYAYLANKGWKTLGALLATVSGYDGGANQVLVNSSGTIQWLDLDDWSCPEGS